MKTHFPQIFQHENMVNNILDELQNYRLENGHLGLSKQSVILFHDALNAVFIQIRDHLKTTQLSQTNYSDFYCLFLEMAQSISVLDEDFNNKFQNILSASNKHSSPFFQTSSLYQLIINRLAEYHRKMTVERCTKTYAELYFLITIWIRENAIAADFFQKKVSFRCLEMVVDTLKGGY